METSPAARKVAFCFLAIVLTLIGLSVLSQPAEAYPGVADNVAFTGDGKTYLLIRGPYIFKVKDLETLEKCHGGQANAKTFSALGVYFAIISNKYGGVVSCPLNLPDGLIFGTAGNAQKYRIIDNKLYTLDDFMHNYCLGGPSNIRELSSDEYKQATSIYPVVGSYQCHRIEYPSGTLVQASGPGVHYIKNGLGYGVPSPAVVACLGGWPAVRKITDTELELFLRTYPSGGIATCPYSLAEGSKILAPSGTVYILRAGKLWGMPSADVLVRCFGGWAGVRSVAQSEIDSALLNYPDGGAASCMQTLPNGHKFKNPNGTVFVLQGGAIYGMPSAAVLEGCFGGWAGVVAVSDTQVAEAYSYYSDGGIGSCAAPPPVAGLSIREQRAIDWAKSQIGSLGYIGYCEFMVEQAFGVRGKEASALSNANTLKAAGLMHLGDTSVPAGKLAFFGASTVNGGYGHVMLSIGNGQFISNGYIWNGQTVGVYQTGLSATAFGPYIGWADAPASWSGR